MSQAAIDFAELEELCWTQQIDNLSPEAAARLEQLVVGSAVAREYYIRYAGVCAFLDWSTAPHGQFFDQTIHGITGKEAARVPLFPFLSTALHATVNYFSPGWPLAYLVGTVIVAIGLLIGSLIPVSQPVQVAAHSALPSRLIPEPEEELVGRITGMVDCKWADPSKAPVGYDFVSLGRQFKLKSGLMEITYATGAKLILQGPVTYEVESKDGGYLAVGKLTACVGKKGSVIGGQQSEAGNRKPEIPHPLFFVRTPIAVATDLGTEFGVEVSKEGHTTTHVFRGSVQLQRTGVVEGKETPDNTIILHANEAACVKFQNGGKKEHDAQVGAENGVKQPEPVLLRTAFNASTFVLPDQMHHYAEEQRLKPLHRWRAYSHRLCKDPTLVAYYTFELSSNASTSILPNLSSHGHALDGRVASGEWVNGRFPGKGAVYFHGRGSGDRVVLPDPDRFEFAGAFSVAIWFKLETTTAQAPVLIGKGDGSWRLVQAVTGANSMVEFGTNDLKGEFQYQNLVERTNVADDRWHLAVAVYKPLGKVARKQIYIDGRLDGENEASFPRLQNKFPVWLGANSEYPDREMLGVLDEVAIFSRALSAEEVTAMFQAGNPEREEVADQ